jgi:uncharacterized protein YkwD
MAEIRPVRTIVGVGSAVAVTVLVILLPLVETSALQSDGVFVGRGRVASPRSGAPKAPDPATGSESSSALEAEIESLELLCFNEVNRLRVSRGLEALEMSADLLRVARAYSRRMAEVFSHTDPEGKSVRERVAGAGIRWQALGENLAYTNGYVSPVAAAMRGWMDSPGHKRNILSSEFRLAAVGAWIHKGTVYFTEIFLR